MSDSQERIRRAEGLDGNWPNLAAYIREMAGEPQVEDVHDDDDGEAD